MLVSASSPALLDNAFTALTRVQITAPPLSPPPPTPTPPPCDGGDFLTGSSGVIQRAQEYVS